MFEFYDNDLDERSVFVNKICKLIMQANEYDIDKSLVALEDIYSDFHTNIRNIYELESTEIPLMGLYKLECYDASNFGFTEDEYQQALENARNACYKFYGKGN